MQKSKPTRLLGVDLDELQTPQEFAAAHAREDILDRRWRRRRSQLYALVTLLAAVGLTHPFGLPFF